MKKGILILLTVLLLLIFHWEWKTSHIGLDVSTPNSMALFSRDGKPNPQPNLSIEEIEVEIPWTRYLPFYQFGRIEGIQKTVFTYKGDAGSYTTANYTEVSRRIGLLPEFSIRDRISEEIETFLVTGTNGRNGYHFDD